MGARPGTAESADAPLALPALLASPAWPGPAAPPVSAVEQAAQVEMILQDFGLVVVEVVLVVNLEGD